MPGKNKGIKYIITAINYATRWPVAQATKEHKGNDIRRFIGKEIIAKFGKHYLLFTDGGTKLKAIDTNIYLAKNGIRLITAGLYHPQANRWVEQLNGSIVEALSKLSADNPKSWINMLSTKLMVCRTQVNRNTGKSPYKLVYGEKPALISTTTGPQLLLPKKVPDDSNPNVQRARKDQEDMEQKIIESETIPLQQQIFQVRYKISVVNHNQHKLDPGLCGPGIVMEFKPNNTYLVKGIGSKTKLKCMHHDCLCLCKARTA